jgi:hypothetical protein
VVLVGFGVIFKMKGSHADPCEAFSKTTGKSGLLASDICSINIQKTSKKSPRQNFVLNDGSMKVGGNYCVSRK